MKKIRFTVVPMLLSDLDDVETIAAECDLSFWSLLDYRRHLEDRANVSLVIKEPGGHNIGFLIARLIMIQPSLSQNSCYKNPAVCSPKIKPESEIEPQIENDCENDCEMEIYNIAVRKNHQTMGAGGELLVKCFESIRDCLRASVWLEVRVSNAEAVSFYMGNGFKVSHRRKNYYSQPVEDALVMKLVFCSD